MELRKKGIYRNAIRSKLGDTTEAIPGITDNSYDIVIMAGGFAHGHLNIQVLWQAARALKKGTHMMLLPRNIGIKSMQWKFQPSRNIANNHKTALNFQMMTYFVIG